MHITVADALLASRVIAARFIHKAAYQKGLHLSSAAADQ